MSRLNRHFRQTSSLRGEIPPKLFEYSCNVSLRYNYLYMEVPKVGCSSIKATLQKLEWGDPDFEFDSLQDVHGREISPLLTPRSISNFTRRVNSGCWFQFAFVREPYSRLLSVYLDKISQPTQQKFSLIHWVPGLRRNPQLEISFDQFVRIVCSQSNRQMDNHWRSQTELLCIPRIQYAQIGRLENFEHDFASILERIGAAPEYVSRFAPHETGATTQLGDFYTESLRAMVAARFSDDFSQFGYSTELQV